MLQGSAKKEAPAGPTNGTNGKSKAKTINWGDAREALKHVTVLAASAAKLVAVTAELAAAWLANNANNRPIRERTVNAYARDMINGAWRVGEGHPIQIGRNGQLLDGQHRLSAVIKAGKTVQMYVLFGVDIAEGAAIDKGEKRSHGDTHKITTGEHLTKMYFAIANAVAWGGDTNREKLTHYEMEQFVATHSKAIDFAYGWVDQAKRGVRLAALGGVLARAYYHVDRARLESFAEVLVTGQAPLKSHRIIVTLRDWMMAPRKDGKMGGGSRSYVPYRKIARALVAYINGENIKSLYEVSEDPFPLPGARVPRKSRR